MTRFVLGLAALSFVAGCTSKDTDTGTECTNTVTPYPAADTTGVYYRSTVEATFKTFESGATLTVADSSGADVAGTPSQRDSTLVFTPTSPLSPSSTYTATAHYSCGDATWSFTTSEVGTSVDVGGLAGKTYQLDLASGRFVEPAGVGTLLQQYVTQSILIGVQTADASKIQMIGAIGSDSDGTKQSPCTQTIPFPSADFTKDPYFQVGPQTTTISVKGYNIEIGDLMISGAFSPDESYIQGAVLSGTIDTRPLVPLINEGGDDNSICVMAAGIGVTCVACSDGQPYCLTLLVDSINATGVDGSVTELGAPLSGGSDDPCIVNSAECSTAPACNPSDTGSGT